MELKKPSEKEEKKEISMLLFKTVYLENHYCPDIEKLEIEDDIIKGYYTCSSSGIATCLACEISVNDFVFLMKEWFYYQGYDISSRHNTSSIFILPEYNTFASNIISVFNEQYSLIKAGENLILHILHNKGK